MAEKKRTALLGAATREAAEKLATREARSMLRVEKDIVNVMCLLCVKKDGGDGGEEKGVLRKAV